MRFSFNSKSQETKKLDVYERMIVSQEFRLAGIQFHHGLRLYDTMKVGTALTIRAEPDNQYDKNAVAVFMEGSQVGYVEKEAAPEIGRLLKNYGPDSTVLVIAAKDDAASLYSKVAVIAYTVFYTLG
jgi:hypothetical protein